MGGFKRSVSLQNRPNGGQGGKKDKKKIPQLRDFFDLLWQYI
jgi:hypothetical protein